MSPLSQRRRPLALGQATAPAHPKISTEDWLNARAATRGVALERSESVLDRVDQRPAEVEWLLTQRPLHKVGGRPSEDGRFAVVAPHVLESFDDFTLAGVDARTLEQVRHQVLAVARRCPPEDGEARLDAVGVAPRPDRA